jgi:hypothetical protein
MTLLRKWTDKPQTGRKCSQCIDPTKDLNPEYTERASIDNITKVKHVKFS